VATDPAEALPRHHRRRPPPAPNGGC
jgi:hypothetical protein